jgi:hypothetical protein
MSASRSGSLSLPARTVVRAVTTALLLAVSVPSGTFAAEAYLFSYFTGRGEEGLKLAWSEDGLRWEAVAGGRSLLTPAVGESPLMRDPHLVQGPDGLFHLVWTTAWESQTIGYATSHDLIHWSEQRALPVMAGIEGTRNCWAPEAVYDAEHGRFVIFWSSTVEGRYPETAGQSEDGYNHRIYFTTTRDWITFTPAEVLFEPGFSVIDATFARDRQRQLHLIIKDETRHPPRKHLRVARAESYLGPFGALQEPFTPDWVEGPTALTVGDHLMVYYDRYRDRQYGARRTQDLQSWEDVSDQLVLPAGIRHGTALSVDPAVVAGLRRLRPD